MIEAPITNGADLQEDALYECLFDYAEYVEEASMFLGFIEDVPCAVFEDFRTNKIVVKVVYRNIVNDKDVDKVEDALNKRMNSEIIKAVVQKKGSTFFVRFYYRNEW